MGEVYLVENTVNGKFYVGKTSHSMLYRKRGHLYRANSGKGGYFHEALRKYGVESFEWSILFTSTDDEELSEKEIEFIQLYQSANKNYGYNLTYGGEGQRCNEETRKKISQSLKGHIKSKEAIDRHKRSLAKYYETHDGANRGKKLSEEQCNRMRQIRGEKHWAYGKHISEAQKKAVSKAQKGRIRTSEEIEKNRQAHLGRTPWNKGKENPETHKSVVCIETNETFSSIFEASAKYPSAGTHISQVCSGKRKTAGGFHWQYVEDEINPL